MLRQLGQRQHGQIYGGRTHNECDGLRLHHPACVHTAALIHILERMRPSLSGLTSLRTFSPGRVQVPKSWLKSTSSLSRRDSRDAAGGDSGDVLGHSA